MEAIVYAFQWKLALYGRRKTKDKKRAIEAIREYVNDKKMILKQGINSTFTIFKMS